MRKIDRGELTDELVVAVSSSRSGDLLQGRENGDVVARTSDVDQVEDVLVDVGLSRTLIAIVPGNEVTRNANGVISVDELDVAGALEGLQLGASEVGSKNDLLLESNEVDSHRHDDVFAQVVFLESHGQEETVDDDAELLGSELSDDLLSETLNRNCEEGRNTIEFRVFSTRFEAVKEFFLEELDTINTNNIGLKARSSTSNCSRGTRRCVIWRLRRSRL